MRQKKWMKKILVLGLAALMLLNLTGCRIVLGIREVEKKVLQEKDPTKTSSLGTGLGITDANEVEEQKLSGSLKLQVFTNESEAHSGAWTNVITAFEEATGIRVTLIMGSQVNTQYSAAWLAGESPADIVWIAGNGIADEEMEASGKFYDLTNVFQEETVWGTDALIADVINMDVVRNTNGGQFRAPLMNSVQGMWYEKNTITEVPTNYDEFLATSKKLTGQGIAGMTYPGMYADYNMWALIMPAVAAYGEDFFNEVATGTPEAFQDERFLAVMERYADYCKKDYVLKGSTSADHTSSQLNWLNKQAGFITNGLWLEAEMADYIPADFEMAFAASPLIAKDQTPTLILQANNLAISSASQNIDNAIAFIRFMYREDVQKEYVSKYSYLPALKTLDMGDTEMSDVARETLAYVESDGLQIVNNRVTWSSLINNTFKSVVNDVTSGAMTAKQACQQLYQDAQR